MLWSWINKEHPSLYWRSRKDNPVNPWYFARSAGHVSKGEWIIFWYGDLSEADIAKCVEAAVDLPPSLMHGGKAGTAGAAALPKAAQWVVEPPSDGYRIGLLGARGHTGSNIISLLSQHPHVRNTLSAIEVKV